MASRFSFSSSRWFTSLLGRSASVPRQFPSSGFKLLNHIGKLEEENWAWYNADSYYPVRLGDVFQSRYQVLGKLGYGAHSTVWLGRDIQAHRYVTLKIGERDSDSVQHEVAAYKHIGTPSHPGAQLLRQLLDSFTLHAPSGGHHMCLVHEPLGISVESLRDIMPGKIFDDAVLKSVLRCLLLALDCLHSKARTIHADIQARNIMFRIGDAGYLESFEEAELQDPSPRKIDGDRIVYESRGLRLPKVPGPPILCDFGEARYGKEAYTEIIQPTVYRAPEVLLGMPWSYPVDIWNVGVLIWSLFEDHELFKARGSDGEYTRHRLAQMYAMLGRPPLEFLQRSEISWEYFEADGTFKETSMIPDTSLEASEQQLTGDDKARFLVFVRKMLQWDPEQRPSAAELLKDPWLMA